MKKNEENLDEIWQRYLNIREKNEMINENKLNIKEKQNLMNLRRENENLAEIQNRQTKYFNNEAYRSIPTDDFYQQFNTSSR